MLPSHRTVLAFVFTSSALLICRAPAAAQTPPAQPTVKRDIARPIQSVEGKEIYREYCAVCHGVGGKGDGPASPAMKVRPSD